MRDINERASAKAILAAMALLGGADINKLIKIPQSRTNCSQCNKEIPPGRPGRKCIECRK